jgi:hypothetical protein
MGNSWPSYWTGWRPVEFARGVIGSEERVFCISKDQDGVNRIWELFLNEKTDNGVPITSFVQTKLHLFESRDFKKFKYAEIEAVNIKGECSFLIAAGALKGAFKPCCTKEVVASVGQVYYDETYGEDGNLIAGTKAQTRIIRTLDGSDPDADDDPIESGNRELIDKGLSLLIVWSGIAGISAYRIFAQWFPDANKGRCEEDEEDTRLLTMDGCGSQERFSNTTPFTVYDAEQTYDQDSVSETCTASSVISQADADRKAYRAAKWKVQSQLGQVICTPSCAYEGLCPNVTSVVSIGHSILE